MRGKGGWLSSRATVTTSDIWSAWSAHTRVSVLCLHRCVSGTHSQCLIFAEITQCLSMQKQQYTCPWLLRFCVMDLHTFSFHFHIFNWNFLYSLFQFQFPLPHLISDPIQAFFLSLENKQANFKQQQTRI